MELFVLCVLVFGLVSASPSGHLENAGDAPLYQGGFFQGDMAGFNPDDRHSIVDNNLLWPEGIMYYELDSSVDTIRDYILDGMREYEDKTCIRFKPRTDDTKDYVKIFWWTGCWSMVGRIGGEQSMSLGNGCHWRGLVVHELGHALGFYHEQQRSDRDQYIKIIWDNVMEGLEDSFTVMNYWESNPLGESFDYDSVMMYESTAFSKDGTSITIQPTKAGVTLIPVWKKDGLSESDVRRVNRLYQCKGEVRPPPPDVKDFICDFESDDCGIVNQENMGSDFNRRVETLGGRQSTVLVMRDADTNGQSIGGRLITKHFQNFGRAAGCLSFDYFVDGPGVEYMSIAMQSYKTEEVENIRTTSSDWRTWKRTINYDDKDPRFFITAVHRAAGSNFVFALDNIKFTVKPC